MKSTLSTLILALASQIAFSQECQCDFTIDPSENQIIFNGNDEGVSPGDVVCLNAGEYRKIILQEVVGTKEAPVVFINCGGQVVIHPSSEGIDSYDSFDFHITGTGSDSDFYGIKITGEKNGGGIGIRLGGFSGNYQVDHIEISDLSTHGMNLKNDPRCDDPRTWRESGNVNDYVIVHNNHISDTGQEAFYIGDSHYHEPVDCLPGRDFKVEESPIINVEVYNNIVHDTGRDGIQVGSTIGQALIYNNWVKNSGLSGNTSHLSNYQINPGTKAVMYNNIGINTTGTAYFILGDGVEMYNNVAYSAETAVESYERVTSQDSRYKIYNNTFLEIFGNALSVIMPEFTRPENIFYNNILHHTGNLYQYSSTAAWPTSNEQNNVFTGDISSLNLQDISNEDFSLTSASTSALDLGDCSVNENMISDLAGFPRTYGEACDIGAYEYSIPELIADKTTLDFGTFGSVDAVDAPDQSYILSGSNMRSSVEIPIPDHFSLSLDPENFEELESLAVNFGELRSLNATIYVRYDPSVPGISTVDIEHFSEGMDNLSIKLIGEVVLSTNSLGSVSTTIYPNPIDSSSSNLLSINLSRYPNHSALIQVIDLSGREFLNYSASRKNFSLALPTGMQTGMYIVKIKIDNEEVTTNKIYLE